MQTVLSVFFSILLLVVVAWIAVFGGIGALLSRSRGGTAPSGLAWGVALGPFGWLAVLWTTRQQRSPASPVLDEPLRGAYLSGSSAPRPRSDRWDPWNR